MNSPTKSSQTITNLEKTITYTHEDGSSEKWSYVGNISNKGPLSIEMTYPKDYDHNQMHDKYINPKTGKVITKWRAKQLGLL